MILRLLTLLLISFQTVRAEPAWITIASSDPSLQLIVSGYPPGSRLDASDVSLRGGKSDHFDPAPAFALRNGSRWDPKSGVGYPDTATLESMELPNEERYPLQIREMESPHLRGATIIGVQSWKFPWRVVKAMWDGDAIHVKHCTGKVVVSDVYFENVEDGFGPGEGLSSWKLERAWMRDIRDDAIENDDLIDGEISNCLIDGCFVFLSQRASQPFNNNTHTVIRDCLVRIAAQPHDGTEGRASRDRNIKPGKEGIGIAPGMIFKWDKDAGEVEVENSIFYMDAISVNGISDMIFPPGSYKNVTLIWTGPGNYPAKIPQGVTEIRDVTVWEEAKDEWIRSMAEEHPGHSITE